MFGRLLRWYTVDTFWWLLPREEILPGAKFTLRPNLAFSYIGSVLYVTALEHWASAKLCGVVQRMELRNFRSSPFSTGRHLYFDGGHHVGHRPTF